MNNANEDALKNPHRRSILTRSMTAIGWVVVAVAYPVLAFGLVWPMELREERLIPSTLIHAAFMVRTFLFHAGVALAVVALRALIARDPRLAITTVPAIVIALASTVPNFFPRGAAAGAADAATIRVFSGNLLAFNRETAEIANEIAACDADVIMLQEFTPHWRDALAPRLEDRYPYQVLAPQTDCFGVAIYSKWPYVQSPRVDVRLGREPAPQIRAVVQTPLGPVVFYNIHLVPPTSVTRSTEQRLELADLLECVRAETLPVVVSGDFNFTLDSLHHRRVREAGFRDVHEIAGCGRGSTWPVKRWTRYVPGIRLDHIYISSQLTAASCGQGVGMGSDHRPVFAMLALVTAPGAIDR
ncbi:MAG: endonuclease/exonuclease/phosphatase family protein [Phycisphaerae bacterium]